MENSHGKQILIFIAVMCLLMLATGNLWGVVETSEARYAEISREMLRSGDWLHPKLLNIYHYHKPPITYWLTATAYTAFGVNPFAVRFFLIFAFCIQAFLVFRIALCLFKNNQVAYNAVLVYTTLPLVLISVRGLTTDAYLTTFVLLSLYCWIKFLDSRKIVFFYCTAAALGLGFITKGPVVFIVPLLAFVGLKKWRPLPKVNLVQVGLALIILMTIGFSWFVFIVAEDYRFIDYFFFRHFVDRMAHAEVFARKEPWYYYLPAIPLVTLPWITFFVGGLLKAKGNDENQILTKRLLLWWFLLPLLAFSISSSKLILYVLPLCIGFSLITGYFLSNEITNKLFWIFSGFLVLLYIALLSIPLHSPQFKIETTMMIVPLTALLSSVVLCFLKLKRERLVLILSALFAMNLILFSSQLFRLNSGQVNALTSVSSFIKENNLGDRNILVYDKLLPSLSFELDKDIISVYASDRSLKREVQFEKNDHWRNFLMNINDESDLTNIKSLLSKKSVLVVKGKLPPTLEKTMPGAWNSQEFGKWTVYYN